MPIAPTSTPFFVQREATREDGDAIRETGQRAPSARRGQDPVEHQVELQPGVEDAPGSQRQREGTLCERLNGARRKARLAEKPQSASREGDRSVECQAIGDSRRDVVREASQLQVASRRGAAEERGGASLLHRDVKAEDGGIERSKYAQDRTARIDHRDCDAGRRADWQSNGGARLIRLRTGSIDDAGDLLDRETALGR